MPAAFASWSSLPTPDFARLIPHHRVRRKDRRFSSAIGAAKDRERGKTRGAGGRCVALRLGRSERPLLLGIEASGVGVPGFE